MDLSGRKILVVDDHSLARECLREMLTSWGAQVTDVGEGTAGLAAIRKGSFDLIISDLYMPGLNGMELVESAKFVNPKIPVVLMSAAWPKTETLKRARGGADGMLAKPFEVSQVVQVISSLLGLPGSSGTPNPDAGSPSPTP
ncbi:MAG: response regulator [Planctomycetes bacterium]|nr:response regulator [Planctomycetota bacterium]